MIIEGLVCCFVNKFTHSVIPAPYQVLDKLQQESTGINRFPLKTCGNDEIMTGIVALS
jgi:hypothetical protein